MDRKSTTALMAAIIYSNSFVWSDEFTDKIELANVKMITAKDHAEKLWDMVQEDDNKLEDDDAERARHCGCK